MPPALYFHSITHQLENNSAARFEASWREVRLAQPSELQIS